MIHHLQTMQIIGVFRMKGLRNFVQISVEQCCFKIESANDQIFTVHINDLSNYILFYKTTTVMFTGVIKLAQIDDYIAPSQSCIQPKIMKKDAQQEKATVSLNDCLACSGCITSAESILIEQMSVNKFLSFASSESNQPIHLILSPQSLLSLSKYYKVTAQQFMVNLQLFMKQNFLKVDKIFDLNQAIEICHNLMFQEFKRRSSEQKFPILCSECPGWVCYAEKTLPSLVVDLMSQVKSPQQIMGQLIRHFHGKQCRIVSVMPCYDKKLEAIRFEIEKDVKQVDLTLSTTELIDLFKKTLGQQKPFITQQLEGANYKFEQLLPDDGQNKPLCFVSDQTSNGYLESLMTRLGVQKASVEVEEIRNADFKQYRFQLAGKQIKAAKCYGFRNIQKIVQLIKKNKCPYQYVEIMACPGGCFSGGGQVRYEGVKNKQIISELEQIKSLYPVYREGLLQLHHDIINQQTGFAKYKPIQKSLTESVMNW